MMPGRIDGFTRDLGRPRGWKEEHCGSLPIRDVVDPDIGPKMVSEWIPDENERAAIAAGAQIRLSVCGEAHPPVSLNVSNYLGLAEKIRAENAGAATAPDLLALVHQYRKDLLYPPSEESKGRRLAAIDAVIGSTGD